MIIASYPMSKEHIPFRLIKRITPFIFFLFTLYNWDVAPPDIIIIQSQEGETYYGMVYCDLQVTDNKSVNRVEVFLNGESVHLFTRGHYTVDILTSTELRTFKGHANCIFSVTFSPDGSLLIHTSSIEPCMPTSRSPARSDGFRSSRLNCWYNFSHNQRWTV